MPTPEFTVDPETLAEVATDPDAAAQYADQLLAQYRALGSDVGEQQVLAPQLITWLRLSGQLSRAEEVARGGCARVGLPNLVEHLTEHNELTALTLAQISPALRLATALQWNSEPGQEKYDCAQDLFDLCVQSAQNLAFGTPPVATGAVLLLAKALELRSKQRLGAQDIFGALRDANLSLSYRLEFHGPDDQIESTWFIVNALIGQLENRIEQRDKSIGASVETETFAAGDRSGFGAVSNAKRVGPWLFWLKTGRLKAFGEYQDDQLHGPWYWFREQGGLLQEGSFKANQQTGLWTRYYSNGNRLDQGTFDDGHKTGPWTYFNQDGSVKKTTVHKTKAPKSKSRS